MNGTLMMTALLLLSLMASGPSAEAQNPAYRFDLLRTEDGFLRIDRLNGAIAACRKDADVWTCKSVDDGLAAYRSEIARLENENREMAKQLETLRQMARTQELAKTEAIEDRRIDRLMSKFEEMLRRFFAFARGTQEKSESI